MSKLDQQLVDEAAEWLITLSSGHYSQDDLAQLESWKQQSPEHLKTFEELQQFLNQMDVLKAQSVRSQHPIIQNNILRKRSTKKKSASLLWGSSLIIAVITAWIVSQLPYQRWNADHSTQAQQWQNNILSDQSSIQMAGQTAYNLQYNLDQRKIHLFEGNILVNVAKDHARPFVVDLGDIQVQALGTKFIVNYDHNQVRVSMIESKTKIYSLHHHFEPIVLETGQRFNFNGEQIQIESIHPDVLQKSWQSKKLVVNDMALDQVLDMLESYQSSKYIYSRKILSQYRVNAVLPLDDPDSAMQLLKDQLRLDTYAVGGLFTVIKKN
ncbi:FecR domain-containing protein [Acinetobacter sp. S40]|uniref:FecR family protein n=1 Tax=unclassified Acinetobacter TaxID=196816 RepID=UPI00190A8FB8|nr:MULTISPECIES: FecR domain-containing protein [unclassified Acinetobacter]MBJ9985245.1 FecR domain-containing protein [Acinetobacter sp. S40]MBK0063268.1 FecR domain-containing protein [Acinetobacter sp. S55]MBK0066820.1 FecR domain-containing protein [Acinetobacter sp. S54]